MKFSLEQLNKLYPNPYPFSFECDFKERIKDIDDINDIDIAYVKGTINKIDDVTFLIKYHLDCLITMACSLTLLDVDYHLDNDFDEIYSKTNNDDYNLIENNTIDLQEMVYQTIILERPIRIVRSDAYDKLKEMGIDLKEE